MDCSQFITFTRTQNRQPQIERLAQYYNKKRNLFKTTWFWFENNVSMYQLPVYSHCTLNEPGLIWLEELSRVSPPLHLHTKSQPKPLCSSHPWQFPLIWSNEVIRILILRLYKAETQKMKTSQIINHFTVIIYY